jgi:subtilisin-like proprotein convertase family protein
VKINYTLLKPFVVLLYLVSAVTFAQTDQQKQQITRNYDHAKLEKLKQQFEFKTKAEKAEALAAAKKNGWDIYRRNNDGTYDELMSLTSDGKPVYYSVENVNAAKSTRANTLNSGGILGLSLDGQNMFSGVWDGGPVRVSHQEFGGRMVVSDGITGLTDNSFHATHVTGTVGATGVSANAKGMAPLSTVKTFDWNNDLAEVLAEAENGLLLSNHSYGIPLDSTPGNWYPGAYSGPAKVWDELAYAVPYYLMVASSGNDGNATNPAPMTAGYDKLTGNKNAKNNLVVANAQDATVDAQGNLTFVAINSSSSEGPTDDHRVKPDITGNGTGLFSTTDASDTSYGTLTGTSMASPNVMGTLLLVQQHYNNVNHRFMRAATLKGLACHTADDKGKVGPDPTWGWGLLNAKKAAQAITNNGLSAWISEETLHEGETFTFTATSDGVTPLLASICWTDVPGTVNENNLNSTTPALVNDLDIRITKDNVTYYPWKLQAAANLAAIRTEDNSVDNVERVNVDNPSGTYTITVTHKGTLQDGPQSFAFVVTGLSSAFSIASISDDQTACLNGNADYTFHFTNAGATPVNLTADGLPNGAVAVFSSPTLTSTGDFTLNITNLQNAVPGVYPITITGNNGLETETRIVNLKIISAGLASINLTTPTNNQTGVSPNTQFNWNAVTDADSYHIQVASDADFTTIIDDATTNLTTHTIAGLNEATTYYWRVFPLNSCGEGSLANAFIFETGQLVCNYHFEPIDYANAEITSTVGTTMAILQIEVPAGITVGDINVDLDITHANVGDLTIVLEGPSELNFPRVTLLKEPCAGNQGIDCTIDDSGIDHVCNATVPTISGLVKPFESLSSFNNKPAQGVWTLYVIDNYTGGAGIVNFAALDFCTVQPALGTKENVASGFSVYPNPTKGMLNIRFPELPTPNTIMTITDIQGRKVLAKTTSAISENLNIDHLANGVYLLSVDNGKQRTTKKIILNK